MAVFGQSGCIRTKVVLFGQKWLFLRKTCLIWSNLLYWGKVVIFGQKDCIPEKCLQSGKMFFFRAKVVVFGQSNCVRAEGI